MANTRGKIILAHISILFARDLNFCDSQKDGLNERFLIDLRLLKLELAIEFSIQSCRLRLLTSMSNPLLISKWFVVILVGGFSFWLFWQVVECCSWLGCLTNWGIFGRLLSPVKAAEAAPKIMDSPILRYFVFPDGFLSIISAIPLISSSRPAIDWFITYNYIINFGCGRGFIHKLATLHVCNR